MLDVVVASWKQAARCMQVTICARQRRKPCAHAATPHMWWLPVCSLHAACGRQRAPGSHRRHQQGSARPASDAQRPDQGHGRLRSRHPQRAFRCEFTMCLHLKHHQGRPETTTRPGLCWLWWHSDAWAERVRAERQSLLPAPLGAGPLLCGHHLPAGLPLKLTACSHRGLLCCLGSMHLPWPAGASANAAAANANMRAIPRYRSLDLQVIVQMLSC